MLTTSVLMLSTSLSILKILSFISVRFFVISLLAAIDSFITGMIYLYKKNPISIHIVVGKPTLFISPTISLISTISSPITYLLSLTIKKFCHTNIVHDIHKKLLKFIMLFKNKMQFVKLITANNKSLIKKHLVI